MNQSLAITFVAEGGLPNLYLSVQDNYNSPAQVFNAPMDFVDLDMLMGSAQATGDYWMVTTSPDAPGFQVESGIFVRHRDGQVHWDVVYEHYEPYLGIDLDDMDDDDFDEHVITFSFDPFQYCSALYQAANTCQQFDPVTFQLDAEKNAEHPMIKLRQYQPKLHILWQKYGHHQALIEHGSPVKDHDYFARESEAEWLKELLDTLDDAHNDNVMDNLDAYLESLPDDILARLEQDSTQLETALTQRWEMLVDSLTEDEAQALEDNKSAEKFPHSLKLRLMREFMEGNPSVLLGNHPQPTKEQDAANRVINLQSWKARRTPKS